MSDADETIDDVVDDDLTDDDDVVVLGDPGDELDDDLLIGDVAADDDGSIFDDDEDVLDDSTSSSDEDEEEEATVPLDVSEDGDDEPGGEPAVDLAAIEGLEVDDPAELTADDELDDVDDDSIREGEFVCSSCHMAKRASALADPDEMLCRDCV